MRFETGLLEKIFEKTAGRCHICHKELAFSNRGKVGRRGAWEIDHSRPRARGGTDRVGNLYAACIPCNRGKGAGYNRTERAKYGHTRAPLSREEEQQREMTVRVLVIAGIGLIVWLILKWLDWRKSKTESSTRGMLRLNGPGGPCPS